MLKKENRLTSKFEFNLVRKYGTSSSSASFHLTYLRPMNHNGPTKVGFVVSNRFDKRAVMRNRVKRIFRELVRQNFAKIKSGYWVVITPRRGCLTKNYEELNAEFNKLLQKIPISR